MLVDAAFLCEVLVIFGEVLVDLKEAPAIIKDSSLGCSCDHFGGSKGLVRFIKSK